MKSIVVVAGPLANASANNIALSQTPGGAGALTLNGALVSGDVAIMDNPREVLITTGDDETARTFTITGTDANGSAVSEVVTGPNHTTAASVLSYRTVKSIVISGSAGAAITVGTNGVGSSPWVRLDPWADPVTALQCTVSGTVNCSIQQTNDDPNSATNPINPNAVTWVSTPVAALTTFTATQIGSLISTPTFLRALMNSGSGTVTMTVNQSGSVTR